MLDAKVITKDPQIRKGIIASVIATVIVIVLIQPILKLAWSALLSFGAQFVQNYVDTIYKSAALGHRNYIDVLLLMGIFSFLSGSILAMTLLMTNRILRPDKKSKKLGKPHLCIIWLILIAFHVLAIFFIVTPYADLQHNTSFQQRLKVLAPVLTETKEEELEALWATMQSRTDFDAIKSQMETLAQDHNLQLPSTLMK